VSTEPPARDAPSGVGREGRAAVWATVSFLAWTTFVWAGRIRNAMADDALDGGGRTGPVFLSLSFLVPAAVLAVLLAGERGHRVGRGRSVLLVGLAGWTTAVWAVRVLDIALAGDHDVPFVAVHTVLGVVSIALGWWAVRATTLAAASTQT
jgi:hypothetical protein